MSMEYLFHHCSILIFIYTLVLLKSKQAKPGNLPQAIVFWKMWIIGYKSIFTFLLIFKGLINISSFMGIPNSIRMM